jgi:2-methylcitrate dehydratase PrpD
MLSKELARFTAEIKYEDLPQETIEMAKRCIEDSIGVAIAGSKKPASVIWQDTMSIFSGAPEATVWRPGFPKVNHLYAACINGAMVHVMDMDDLHNTSIVHLAVVTVPAAIAVGQRMRKSGRDIITAVVAGYDVGARIGEAINPSSYWFWHTTGVAGNFSAAATVGKLLNLNPEEINHCFGSAGSQAAGLWEFMYDGAMSKTLHAGKACMNGIIAAELASRGFTGASRILEGEKGFVKALAKEYNLDVLTKDFAKPYKIMTNSFKPYACCRHTHSAIYGIQQLSKEFGLKPEEVKVITDKTYSTAVGLTDNSEPKTIYGHKFSLQYCIAAALVYGNVLDDVFSDEKTRNPLVRETMNKVNVILDPQIDEEYKANPEKWIHHLEIETKEGKIYKKRVEYPLGDYNNPFDWEMTDGKFINVTGEFLTDGERKTLLEKLHNLEDIDDINCLFE